MLMKHLSVPLGVAFPIALASLLSACSTMDHAFAPTMYKTTLENPAPYSAPPVTGKRKIGNPYEIMGETYYPIPSSEGYTKKGVASWYGKDFHGKLTANGETYNMYDMTAAHPTLPIPTYVRVTNLDNGLSTVVRVNDRGPFLKNRVIDLSYKAAVTIDMADAGTANVYLEALPTDGSVLRTSTRYAGVPVKVDNKPIYNRVKYSAPNVERDAPAAKPVAKAYQSSGFTHRISAKSGGVPLSEARLHALPVKGVFVQTGAYGNLENANRQVAELSKVFKNVKLFAVNKNGKQLHRVRIGPFEHTNEADEILAKVMNEGWTSARIVVD